MKFRIRCRETNNIFKYNSDSYYINSDGLIFDSNLVDITEFVKAERLVYEYRCTNGTEFDIYQGDVITVRTDEGTIYKTEVSEDGTIDLLDNPDFDICYIDSLNNGYIDITILDVDENGDVYINDPKNDKIMEYINSELAFIDKDNPRRQWLEEFKYNALLVNLPFSPPHITDREMMHFYSFVEKCGEDYKKDCMIMKILNGPKYLDEDINRLPDTNKLLMNGIVVTDNQDNPFDIIYDISDKVHDDGIEVGFQVVCVQNKRMKIFTIVYDKISYRDHNGIKYEF